jgi:hypothetical protein
VAFPRQIQRLSDGRDQEDEPAFGKERRLTFLRGVISFSEKPVPSVQPQTVGHLF